MNGFKLVALRDDDTVEADERAALAEELGHQEVEAAAVEVDRIVDNAQVGELGELEYFHGLLHRLDLVLAQVQVHQFGKLRHFVLESRNLVLPQIEAFEGGECTLPASELGDHIGDEVELLELRAVFEDSKVLEFVIVRCNDADRGRTSPLIVDFLELVPTDVQVVQLGATEGRPLIKLVE